jgi:hypothetical protein
MAYLEYLKNWLSLAKRYLIFLKKGSNVRVVDGSRYENSDFEG